MSKSSQLDQEPTEGCTFIHPIWNDLSKVWTLPVIHELGHKEPARFNELKRRMAGINATSLAERLTELERHGIVQRKVLPETPPRVEYSLTPKGWELHKLSCEIAQWVKRWNEAALIAGPIPGKAKNSSAASAAD